MALLILLRHGQSMWNLRNIFTGWVDVPLSAQGVQEALTAGKQLADTEIDCIYTSTLMRAQQTAMLVMCEHSGLRVPVVVATDKDIISKSTIYAANRQQQTIPTYIDWRLNERYYGELQGVNKTEMVEKFGADQVKLWRRSYDVPPPNGESLKMTCQRTLPCLNERILPDLAQGHNCLVSAHGNSLRSIVMSIESLDETQVL